MNTHDVGFDHFRTALTEWVNTAWLNGHLSEAFALWIAGYPAREVGDYLREKERNEKTNKTTP